LIACNNDKKARIPAFGLSPNVSSSVHSLGYSYRPNQAEPVAIAALHRAGAYVLQLNAGGMAHRGIKVFPGYHPFENVRQLAQVPAGEGV
jgi:hypothetical protein